MKITKKYGIGIILLISLALLIFPLISSSSCNNDGGLKCVSLTEIQSCTDWDGSGLNWGWCSGNVYGSSCLGKSAVLNLGLASNDFGVTPMPPQALWGDSYGCFNSKYYEVSCTDSSVNYRILDCANGCDGDRCKNLIDNCNVGDIQCSTDKKSSSICLDTNDGTNWGEYSSCESGTTCINGEGCKTGGNNFLGILVVLVIVGILGFVIYKKS